MVRSSRPKGLFLNVLNLKTYTVPCFPRLLKIKASKLS